MKKTVLFAFNGEAMCFVHVLLNALDMRARGHEVGVVLEGAATGLLPQLARPESPLHGLYVKVKEAGLIFAVCKACAQKLGALDAALAEGLPLGEDMSGHAGMAAYLDNGFEVITF